ncbi:hypothetical protein SLEP1_g36230 [Rubroshorea leprosula]|uniref:OVATE domain-containing protein n=1 Tax=Rubroshorea leprosula TaxID=152421 RepID=A0AAV5KRC2_9ROSI|nr:hypothetical protein SLEP1_g36230 [Rubroshorea leprosula]
MQLRTSIEKTRIFFHKPLLNLRSFFFGGYQRLPKPHLLINPLSCGGDKKKKHRADQYYADFYSEWDFNFVQEEKRKKNAVMPSEELVQEEEACRRSFRKNQSPVKKEQENGEKEEKKNTESSYTFKREEQFQNKKGGSSALEQKMKAFEMMDIGDVEQVLDVEEALHYYSRLRSPVYLDIVDKFFTDMYSEFSVPQASASIKNSKRRLGSIRL